MKIVGSSIPIHDALGKATGAELYAGDMELQNMLHVAVLFSPIPHGNVKKIDCTKALAYSGVVDIIHCFNTTDKTYNRYHTQYRQDLIHNECIFNKRVRFVGDRVAAVIAQTEEIAREAVKLIEVEYEELPYSLDLFETLDGKIPDVHKEGAVYGDFQFVTGEEPVDSDIVNIDFTTQLSRINHMCMETHACVADYKKSSKQLTIYSPSQTVFGIRTLIADLLDLDYSKVRAVKTTMGGSFGAKQEWMLEPVAAAAAIKVGRPVRLVYNREETIKSTICRAPMYFKSRFMFKPDGKLAGIESDMTLDAGAYVGNSINYAKTVAFKFFRVYKYAYNKYTCRVAITNTIVNGAFRGWTSPETTIMVEHGMNMAARKLNIDPLEIRIKNTMEPNDIDPRINTSVGDFRGIEALEMSRDKFNWENRKEEIKRFNAENTRYKRGMGVAIGGHVNGFYPSKPDFARVDMKLTESGSVICNVTLHDHGCGTVTAFKMIVAEELGIPVDMVNIKEGDTDVTPLDVGCFSSRTTYVIGRAAQECAKKFKERLKEHISKLDKIPMEDLACDNMMVYSTKDENIKYTWSDVFNRSQQEYYHEVYTSYEYVNTTNPGVAAVNTALVEVDTYTGMVKILDYLVVQDLGQAINREICIAQTQGAVVMGSGAALTEHVTIKPNGVPMASLKDYHLINSYEAPKVRVEFIENQNTEGPFGAKTIGEICHVPVTATIVGAVNDALQSDMNHVPLTPDVILEYLRNKSI